VPPWALARAACAAGRPRAAIDWLEQAAGRRSSSLPFMRVTPAFDALHGEERFVALGRALRLPGPGASAAEGQRDPSSSEGGIRTSPD
jgi:hypothetical protein